MNAEIVVLQPFRQIPPAFQAAVHQRRIIRRRRKKQIGVSIGDGICLIAHIRGHVCQNAFEGLPAGQALADRPIGRRRKRYGADVDHLHAFARNNEFPAGGHGIIAGVLQIVAMSHERRDRHVVVGVLRKAQTLARQFGGQAQQFDVRFRRDAQVDFRIDHADIARGPQRHARQFVDRARAVPFDSAEHQRLPVVALLHSGIQVAVLVQADEKLRQQLLGGGKVETPGLQIGFQIGPHVLIESAKADMIVAAQPDGGPQQQQRLQRLVESARRIGRRMLEHLRQIALAQAARFCGVAPRQVQHGVDGFDGAFEEFHRFGVGGQALARFLGRSPPAQQALRQGHAPIGADVADRPQLVLLAPREQGLPVLLSAIRRDAGNGAGESDAFVIQNRRPFGLALQARQQRGAPRPGKPPLLAGRDRVGRRGLAQIRMRASADALAHGVQSCVHRVLAFARPGRVCARPGRTFRKIAAPLARHAAWPPAPASRSIRACAQFENLERLHRA
ncbi:MAG: hypothetical protein BWZ10_02760 [candidate division BRC1 bacterium ADurb.BinA364]|nr:MAG: hypothetical protein BWZ10_02760 [candidate division BRC1 bacterium ADurb.BinA364]